jgi:Flp pilus assembly protein TadD
MARRRFQKIRPTPAADARLDAAILRGWRPFLWIAGVVLLVYFRALSAGFVHLDDHKLIVENFSFINDLANLPRLFVDDVFHEAPKDSFYRPILALSLMVDSQVGQTAPWVYHLTNVLIHVSACWLAYRLLLRMRYPAGLSLAAALVFAVHPLLAQAVAWVPGRNDSLLAVFCLGAFLLLLRFLETKRWRACAGHLLFFALACFTKETALALVPVCLLYLFAVAGEKPFSSNLKILAAGWAGVLGLWAALRSVAIAGPGWKILAETAAGLPTNFPVVVQAVGKMLLPFNLSVLPTVEDTGSVYGLLSVAALAAALVFSKNVRWKHVLFGAGWFALFLAPTLVPTFVVPGSLAAIFLEHRNYLPLIGVILVALEIDWVRRFDPAAPKQAAVFLIVAGLFAGLTWARTGTFKDKFSYWQSAVQSAPGSSVAHMNLGSAYQTEGLLVQAEAEFRKTLELNPRQAMAYSNLADIDLERDRLEAARENLRRGLEADPLYADIHYGLAKLAWKEKRWEASEAALRQTLRIKPEHFAAHFGLGLLTLERGRLEEAEAAFKKAAQLNPFDAGACFNLGLVFSRQGRPDEAEGQWLKAIRLKPGHLDARFQLAVHYFNRKEFARAAPYFAHLREAGIPIDPKVIEQLGVP